MSTVTQVLTSYPSLPYSLQVGSLRWTDKIEDYPTGEIVYKSCTYAIAQTIANAYPDLTQISIEGLGFVVAAAGVSIHRSRYGRGDIDVYDVSVQLESKWKALCQRKVNLNPFLQRDNFSRFKFASGLNVAAIAAYLGVSYSGPGIFYSPTQSETTFEEILKTNCRRIGCFVRFSDVDSVKLIPIDGVGSYYMPDSVVIDSGTKKRNPILPIIDRVAITGEFTRDPFDQVDALMLPIQPVLQASEQGKDASTLSPQEASGVLKSLDSNFDVSGPKKIYTKTQLVDNVVIQETTKIYGYMYRGIDIAQGSGTSFRLEGSPSLYWQQIEEQVVTYTYKSIFSVFSVSAVNQGKQVRLFANPDSVNVISVNGNQIVLNNAKYMIGTTTTGWKYVRFQKESTKLESIYASPPAVSNATYLTSKYTAELCDFQKIPISGTSGVETAPLRSIYGKSTPTPFTIEIQKYTDLSPDTVVRGNIPVQYKTQNGIQVIDDEYYVGIVTANPTDSEPFWLKSESSFKSAFAYAKSPVFNPYRPEVTRKVGDYRPEYLFTGDEAYTSVIRQVFVDANNTGITNKYSSEPFDYAELYEEISLNDSAQGSNFTEAASEATKSIKKGKPPIAQAQIKKWGNAREVQLVANPNAGRNYTYNKYYASSDLVGAYPANIVLRYTDSDLIDLPYAKTQADAVLLLETDLRMIGINDAVVSKKIAWYYPTIRSGDRVGFSDGQLRASTVSNSLEYRGLQNGNLMVISEGTQVDCGFDQARTVTLKQATFARNLDSKIAPDVRVTTSQQTYGSFVYNTSQRRNFNAPQ